MTVFTKKNKTCDAFLVSIPFRYSVGLFSVSFSRCLPSSSAVGNKLLYYLNSGVDEGMNKNNKIIVA